VRRRCEFRFLFGQFMHLYLLTSYDYQMLNSTFCCHVPLFSCVLGCFNASVSVNVGHYVITLGSRSQVPKCAALDPFYFFYCAAHNVAWYNHKDAWMIKDGSVLGCVVPSTRVELIML
jgi:hypothetical protein